MNRVLARPLDKGMGVAVARRTVFRPDDHEDMGRVADRVARGNMSLVDSIFSGAQDEELRLRNAIASGALITSGRHLQHGDETQSRRNMEVFTNCSSAIISSLEFYLLLNGSGVGATYDDDLRVIDWAKAPRLIVALSRRHGDYPRTKEALFQFARDFKLIGWNETIDSFNVEEVERFRDTIADDDEVCDDLGIGRPDSLWKKVDGGWVKPSVVRIRGFHFEREDIVYHRIADSREGWAKGLEVYEGMAYREQQHKLLIISLSDVRDLGAPIGGMQSRPASGPYSIGRVFINIDRHASRSAKARDPKGIEWHPWEQAMHVDHYASEEVQVGGARRAARMATKNWRDKGIFRFIRIKSEGGLWTSNNSVMVDADFWRRVDKARRVIGSCDGVGSYHGLDDLTVHAWMVFQEVTRCCYINGEPGFINGDKLEDTVTGVARRRPVGTEFDPGIGSRWYKPTFTVDVINRLSRAFADVLFPTITNPCGEVPLHPMGAYCVIADNAPLFSCPCDFMTSGMAPVSWDMSLNDLDVWDSNVEDSVRLNVRFLMRVNLMDSLYAAEIKRTNRIGVSLTGIHEWAWARFGYTFRDLVDEDVSAPFWSLVSRLSAAAKDEAARYAEELGVEIPVTVMTIKPAGTTSKLYGLTEGAHLPVRRQYLRWVQFRGQKDSAGDWIAGSDPLLSQYEAKGYPVRQLKTFQGMSIVGFPTVPLLSRMMPSDLIVTAPEATPAEQYQWLKLLEKHWLGERQGGQISYTMKVYTDRVDINSFRDIVLEHQRQVRCCAILPSRPDSELGFEYLPEEEVSIDRFLDIASGIRDADLAEAIDMEHLACASGACPI